MISLKNYCLLTLLVCFFTLPAFCQTTPSNPQKQQTVFERISENLKNFKPDTAVPGDKITRKIKELRRLNGGFNINEAIDFKLEEERQKNELTKEESDKLTAFFKTGKGNKWLENAVIHIYRNAFTYNELTQLVEFYKTPAGRKIASEFPLIMLKSFMAAEFIKSTLTNQTSPAR